MPICVLENVGWIGKVWTRIESKLLILLALVYFVGPGGTGLDKAGGTSGGEGWFQIF
jgi:hypothetical protein